MLTYMLFLMMSLCSFFSLYAAENYNLVYQNDSSPTCATAIEGSMGALLCGVTLFSLTTGDLSFILPAGLFCCPLGSYFCYDCSRTFCCSGSNQRRNEHPVHPINKPWPKSTNRIFIKYPNPDNAPHI